MGGLEISPKDRLTSKHSSFVWALTLIAFDRERNVFLCEKKLLSRTKKKIENYGVGWNGLSCPNGSLRRLTVRVRGWGRPKFCIAPYAFEWGLKKHMLSSTPWGRNGRGLTGGLAGRRFDSHLVLTSDLGKIGCGSGLGPPIELYGCSKNNVWSGKNTFFV